MITLKIKTPIWTGDIDSKSDSLQSTGIMGSVRWWTEAILRGMGKFTCDPVGDDRCPTKVRKNNQEIVQYCSTCLVFGATGIRKMFKLYMNGGAKIFSGGSINIKPNGRNRGWYLGSGLIGKINLDVITLDKDFEENLILVPLAIAVKWGGLGAKTQHGYGIVDFENYSKIEFDGFKETLHRIIDREKFKKLKIEGRSKDNESLPNIKEMFFAKVQFEADDGWWKGVDGIKGKLEGNKQLEDWIQSGSVPISPAIKNWLRFGAKITSRRGKKLQVSPYKEVSNREISQWLFGSSDENNKTSSKINLSCAYHINNSLWEFRIWGWIPESSPSNGFDRKGFLDNLKKSLDGSCSVNIPWNNLLGSKTKDHKLKVWREFYSLRDMVKPNENNTDNYLQSLLEGEI